MSPAHVEIEWPRPAGVSLHPDFDRWRWYCKWHDDLFRYGDWTRFKDQAEHDAVEHNWGEHRNLMEARMANRRPVGDPS